MRRSPAPSNSPGTFFAAQFSAGYTANMSGFDLREGAGLLESLEERMKVGILAGGFGTRLAEETEIRPKPMVEIGGMPILWHIMMHYHTYGHREFAVALGYKGDHIKRWFAEYKSLNGSMTDNMATGEIKRHA